MINRKKVSLWVVIGGCVGMGTSLFAAGANFLKLGVGARALALGSAYTGVAEDVTALYWNTAGLGSLVKKEISAMHAEMIADTRYDYIGYAHPTSKVNLGISAVYLTQGDIGGRTAGRAKTDDFTANDLAVAVGGGKHIGERLDFGIGAKIIQSRIAQYSTRGYAFDLGLGFRPDFIQSIHGLRLGIAVQNIGPRMSYVSDSYNLPLTVAEGLGFEPVKSVLLSADVKHYIHERQTHLSVGAEFTPISLLSLRAGFSSGQNTSKNILERQDLNSQLSSLAGLALGMGFKIGSGSIDYSFTPSGELGNIQRVSLGLKF